MSNMCPSCGDVPETSRQDKVPNRCSWCGCMCYGSGVMASFDGTGDVPCFNGCE
jgi:hypothetical protein